MHQKWKMQVVERKLTLKKATTDALTFWFRLLFVARDAVASGDLEMLERILQEIDSETN